jgi:hypothetical protein
MAKVKVIEVKGQIHKNGTIFTKFCTHVYSNPRSATTGSDLTKVKVIEVWKSSRVMCKFIHSDLLSLIYGA